METKDLKICVVGAGNIGSAMVHGLAAAGARIAVWNRSAGRLEAFAGVPGVSCHTDMAEALAGCDIALVCVEGCAVEAVCARMAACFGDAEPVVGSCAAAASLAELGDALATGGEPYRRVFRLLPNIGAVAGLSTNLYCSQGLTEEEDKALIELFGHTGPTVSIEERLFPAAMALSSCGVAYALRYVRANMQAGVQAGLAPGAAMELTMGAMASAVRLLEHDGTAHPEALVDRVCTPGGVTIRGLNAMEDGGFSAAVVNGLLATLKK